MLLKGGYNIIYLQISLLILFQVQAGVARKDIPSWMFDKKLRLIICENGRKNEVAKLVAEKPNILWKSQMSHIVFDKKTTVFLNVQCLSELKRRSPSIEVEVREIKSLLRQDSNGRYK